MATEADVTTGATTDHLRDAARTAAYNMWNGSAQRQTALRIRYNETLLNYTRARGRRIVMTDLGTPNRAIVDGSTR
jgi:hypothetical protein